MALNVSLHFGPQRIFLEKGVFEFADATVTAAAFYISVLYIALGMQNIGQEIFGNVCVFMKKLSSSTNLLKHSKTSAIFYKKCPLTINVFFIISHFSNSFLFFSFISMIFFLTHSAIYYSLHLFYFY